MLKKCLLILLTVFTIICIASTCFASDMGNDIKNVMNSGTNTIVDGASNLAGSVRNGIGHVENGVEDALNMDDTNIMNAQNTNMSTGATGNYSATRTATTTSADNTTMWVWLIVAVAAIVIVALVWYYGSQNRVD